MKSEYFRKALSGAFKESEYQRVELPEEDPAIFHFLIAYLYEGIYDPIKPVASILGEIFHCLGPLFRPSSRSRPQCHVILGLYSRKRNRSSDRKRQE